MNSRCRYDSPRAAFAARRAVSAALPPSVIRGYCSIHHFSSRDILGQYVSTHCLPSDCRVCTAPHSLRAIHTLNWALPGEPRRPGRYPARWVEENQAPQPEPQGGAPLPQAYHDFYAEQRAQEPRPPIAGAAPAAPMQNTAPPPHPMAAPARPICVGTFAELGAASQSTTTPCTATATPEPPQDTAPAGPAGQTTTAPMEVEFEGTGPFGSRHAKRPHAATQMSGPATAANVQHTPAATQPQEASNASSAAIPTSDHSAALHRLVQHRQHHHLPLLLRSCRTQWAAR